MWQYLKEAGYSLYSTLKGLRVTGINWVRPETTVQYPDVRPDLAPRFRGLPEVDLNICIVCHICEKVCPTQCIHIEEIIHTPSKDAEPGAAKPDKKKEATVFDINSALCMFCGMCEEACPTKPVKSIVLSHNFEVAKYERQDMVYGIDAEYVNAPSNPPPTRS